jgi:hypothetical protein
MDDGKYVDVGKGKLQLQRHKTNGTSRLLLHSLGTGKLMANVVVPSNLSFQVAKSEPGAKNPRGQICFISVVDPSRGPEKLYLVTRFDLLDETAKNLRELAKSTDS